MNHGVSILDSFPERFRPRDIQTDVLKKIEESLKSYKKIIISAPTGVGKSPIGMTVARHLGSSFVVTASKQLQDQYSKEYPTIKPIKGQTNYPCLKLMENKKIEDEILAMSEKLTCEKGKCNEGKDDNGKVIFCKFKPDIEKITKGDTMGNMCRYYDAKYEALTSDHSIWNYYGYFQLMLNHKTYAKYLGKNVGVFDEAHKIEDQMLGFVGVTITNRQLKECGVSPERFNLSDIDGILELLDSMRKSYADMLKAMEEDGVDSENREYVEAESNMEKMATVRQMIEDDKENYITNSIEKEEFTGKITRISVKPIETGKYAEMFFKNEHQIFMSATIDKKNFCQSMKIDESEIDFIDTHKSPFGVENRKINFDFCGAQGGSCTPENRTNLIRRIDEILDDNAGTRGLILTSSRARCDEIERRLSSRNQGRILQCHSSNRDGRTQDQIINYHKKTQNSVLLSSSLWEGVDLVDDMSRFQIIAKIPYPDLSDKRNSIKRKRQPEWFSSQAVMKTLQGCGRSIRSEDDWAVTYVLDSAFGSLIRNAWGIIPKAYHDVLQIAAKEQEAR